MDLWIALLNGLSYGLLLFMLSAGLTLILSLMGVLNFAHAGFYMLGAYLGYGLASQWGFFAALLGVPLLVGLLGAAVEQLVLRRVRAQGHVAELMVTVGVAYVLIEAVQLGWGRAPLPFEPPVFLQGPAFAWAQLPAQGVQWLSAEQAQAACAGVIAQGGSCHPFPATRAFIILCAVISLAAVGACLAWTRWGLILQGALTHAPMMQALGHNVPRVFTLTFAAGSALAGLAGLLAGMSLVTEPGMAASVGSLLFVVIILGGLGSLAGAWWVSLALGILHTLPIGINAPVVSWLGITNADTLAALPADLTALTVSQVAPLLPFILLIVVLALRPRGLMGRRDT